MRILESVLSEAGFGNKNSARVPSKKTTKPENFDADVKGLDSSTSTKEFNERARKLLIEKPDLVYQVLKAARSLEAKLDIGHDGLFTHRFKMIAQWLYGTDAKQMAEIYPNFEERTVAIVNQIMDGG